MISGVSYSSEGRAGDGLFGWKWLSVSLGPWGHRQVMIDLTWRKFGEHLWGIEHHKDEYHQILHCGLWPASIDVSAMSVWEST